jgi:predicted nucleic acid-binding protein
MGKTKVEEVLEKAKKEGEIFLCKLSAEELRRTGFEEEEEFFNNVEFVDIYLLYDGSKYKIKYLINGDQRYFIYEREDELGKYFREVLESYLR